MGRKAEAKCLSAAGVSFGLAAALVAVIYQRNNSTPTLLLSGLGEIILLLSGWMAYDMYKNRPADTHSFKSLFAAFGLNNLTAMGYKSMMKKLRKETLRSHQDKLLMEILKLQAGTVYGREHNFSEIKDREEFRRAVPLNTYKDFESYINRIADDGEENVLTVDKIVGLSTSSGTTGKSKRIPFVDRFMKECRPLMIGLMQISKQRSPKLRYGRIVVIGYKQKVTYSKTGIPIAGLSYHLSKHAIPGMAVSPAEIMNEVEHEEVALYCHAVFGFGEREVSEIHPAMSTMGHSFFRLCEKRFNDICDDIAKGSLKRCPGLDDEMRLKLEKYLTPKPDRAEEVRREFEKGNDGLMLRIWPDCLRAVMMTTGGFAAHARILAESYMKGVYFSSMMHSSSEGVVGLNFSTDPNVHDYNFAPTNIFFELIPEENIGDDDPKTIFVDEVEVGKSYEIVMTTTMGLYRYRLGDVVKITGHFHSYPSYEFQYRVGQMLNLYYEKTPENVFYSALCAAETELGVKIRDYTTCEDLAIRDGIEGLDLADEKQYVLFIELIGDKVLPKAALKVFDEKLKEEFDIYKNLRENGSIGEMTVVQVNVDSFQQIKDVLIKYTQNLQFKMPRVLRRLDTLQILVDNKIV